MLPNVFFFLQTKETVKFLNANDNIYAGLQKMRMYHYSAMPVINDQGHYLGSVREGDFLWYLVDHPDKREAELRKLPLRTLVHKNFIKACRTDVDIDQLFQMSLDQNFVPIVDDRNIFIGIVTRRSIIAYLLNQARKIEPYVSERLAQEEMQS
ncbi:CBS domain-containing protein [Catenisphaera adipataccumulans]|uniref:Putative transcriptional regulator n=2 Tax=Catenisphaera adipataccumulans TaxID=700500 RepID=A0A7W8CZ17_9FIRM|nr:CBS domain-containing protein [Catenisphaera adipataccumulans]MBB5182585.1 putative transcriptional regulator [Catenisphaera adipataccumulans]